jgi:hypothetical protein
MHTPRYPCVLLWAGGGWGLGQGSVSGPLTKLQTITGLVRTVGEVRMEGEQVKRGSCHLREARLGGYLRFCRLKYGVESAPNNPATSLLQRTIQAGDGREHYVIQQGSSSLLPAPTPTHASVVLIRRHEFRAQSAQIYSQDGVHSRKHSESYLPRRQRRGQVQVSLAPHVHVMCWW